MLKVYLSPANHPKPYANRSHEKKQMEKLAPIIKGLLENHYVNVLVYLPATFDKDQQYTGRPQEAKKLGCDLYVALHTNAMSNKSTGGTATGACGFYHPAFIASKRLAVKAVENLNAACPFKSNRAAKPAVYAQGLHVNLGELRETANLGICPVLIEHEFHDRMQGAEWICNNLEDIAKADARAIADTLGLRKRGDVNNDGAVDNLDAAQILRYDAGLIDFDETQLKAADYNGDGYVDNLDAVKILKEDAGI